MDVAGTVKLPAAWGESAHWAAPPMPRESRLHSDPPSLVGSIAVAGLPVIQEDEYLGFEIVDNSTLPDDLDVTWRQERLPRNRRFHVIDAWGRFLSNLWRWTRHVSYCAAVLAAQKRRKAFAARGASRITPARRARIRGYPVDRTAQFASAPDYWELPVADSDSD